MRNMRLISLIALILLVVGIIGSALTFKSYYQTDVETTEQVTLGKGIENIHILTNNSQVEVVPTNDSDITAELSTNSKKYELVTDVENKTLFIEVKNRQKSFIGLDFFIFRTTLTVYVPEKVYDSLQVESDNGRISMENVQAKDVYVKADNGLIDVKNIESDGLTAKVSNGRVTVENVNSSTVHVTSSNGKINLNHVEGDIYGSTNNGSISLNTTHLDRPIELETENGKIHIQTEQEPTNVTFDIRLDIGRARVFGVSNWDTIIGNGEHLIKLTTDNGSITVTK